MKNTTVNTFGQTKLIEDIPSSNFTSENTFEETKLREKVLCGNFVCAKNILEKWMKPRDVMVVFVSSTFTDTMVERNILLSQKLREELIEIGCIPEYHHRKNQSSIVSIAKQDSLLKLLEDHGVRASYRGKYLRFSIHFYNTFEEIHQLTSLMKQLT